MRVRAGVCIVAREGLDELDIKPYAPGENTRVQPDPAIPNGSNTRMAGLRKGMVSSDTAIRR